ncbi:phosphoglycerate dehydrogenase [bacterium]|nr:phosphoglycerate dehydrogenase [bacterium]
MNTILATDPVNEKVVRDFTEKTGIEIHQKTSLTEEELLKEIANYKFLVVRSGTQVTKKVIEAGKKLKIIARAGVGVDNVDTKAASSAGILVINAPDGNTVSAAEHTLALILSSARNIPQAHQSLVSGKWERKNGFELNEKTIGIVGFGKIGREVAKRSLSFGMKVLAFDPFLSLEVAEKLKVKPATLEEIWENAEIITLHVPQNKQTEGMINKETFAKLRKKPLLVNCARGKLINQNDLIEALKTGKIRGVALDVFPTEPPEPTELFTLPNAVLTPHLGASTVEASKNVTASVLDEIALYVKTGSVLNAVNSPISDLTLLTSLKTLLSLSENIGVLGNKLSEKFPKRLKVSYFGKVSELKPIACAFLVGFFKETNDVNYFNVFPLCSEKGIEIVEELVQTTGNFDVLRVEIESEDEKIVIEGSLLTEDHPKILRINGFEFEFEPKGEIVLIENSDIPGVIGKIGMTLAEKNVNIAEFRLARNPNSPNAMAVLKIDSEANTEILEALKKINGVKSVKQIKF